MISRQTITGGLIALLFIGGGCASTPTDSEQAATPKVVAPIAGFVPYDQTANLNFKIQVPKDWTKDESVDEQDIVTAFYSPLEDKADTYQDNVVITALNLPEDVEVTVQEFAEQSHEGLKKSVEKLVLKEIGKESVGGVTATKFEFSGQLNYGGNKINIKGEEYFIVGKKQVYNFTFGAAASKFDSFKPVFGQILGSVEIK